MYSANEDFAVPLFWEFILVTPRLYSQRIAFYFYRVFLLLVGRDGVEPPESLTTDLQSAPLPLTVYLPI